jgi:dihydroflavonol-4-reductase
MTNTVLVTGANGFLGGHVVRELLARHYAVRALVRPGPSHLTGLPLTLCPGDITRPAEVARAAEGCAYVIHAAALASVNPARSAAHWQVNLVGTENVLRAAQRAGVRRLVYVGTANVFGFGSRAAPGTERHPYAGARYGLDYMDSKRAATDRVLAAAAAGLPAVLVHPTFMLGPVDAKPTSGALLLELARGRVPGYPPGGKNYVHVRDVATATVNALTRGRVGESYLLGHENLSFQDAFRLMAEVLGVPAPRLALPGPLLRGYGWLGAAAAALTGRPAALNGAMLRVACNGHYFDCQKAVRELDLPQTPVRTAVAEAADWFRQHGFLPPGPPARRGAR